MTSAAPTPLSYLEMMRRYAVVAGLPRRLGDPGAGGSPRGYRPSG